MEKIELYSDAYFMKEAIKEAVKAKEKNEVPIGCVVVLNKRVIARGHNLTETLNDVTAHAEMQCITAAENFLGAKYLQDCTIYITLEPCLMCAGALRWAQVGRIVFGAKDLKYGFGKYIENIVHPKTEVMGGLMEQTCGEMLTQFFKDKRIKKGN